jgi:hypothetical protein
MNKPIHLAIFAVLCIYFTTGALAHHSRFNFDLETVIEMEGVVTEYSWRNPHSYTRMDVVGENGETVNWMIEMQSTPMLIRLGWAPESLKVGDKITAIGNPDKDPNKYFLYLDDIVTETGVLWGEIPDAGFTPSTDVRKESTPRPEALQRIMDGVMTANAVDVSGDFVGTWIPNYGGAMNLHIEDAFFSAERNARLTPGGEEMIANYSDDDDPSYGCVTYSIPYVSTMPFPTRMSRDEVDGQAVMLMEYSWMLQKRLIYLDSEVHPDDIEPSVFGHSIGRFEEDGKMLVIDTIGFSESTWGTARGIHQSEQKHVVEKYRLSDNGERIEYLSFTMDPPYLAEPLVRFLQYQNERGREFNLYDCDTESATRHLEFQTR